MTDTEDESVDDGAEPDDAVDVAAFHDAVEELGRPVVTAGEVARTLDRSQAETDEALEALAAGEGVERLDVSTDPVVWYPTDWGKLADRERVVVFPERRELVVDQPTQFTRAQLSQFAHLTDTTSTGSYRYEIRQEDVWAAPFDDFDDLLGTVRDVLPERSPHLEAWLESQYERARKFTLRTHEDGYVVLDAESDDLMGNVARQKLDDGQLRAPISDSESWVAEDAVAEVKRVLYEAGYPVQDDRELETGEPLDVTLDLDLRPYQREWVAEFVDRKSGVLVGPPGSGKTVAGMGAIEAVGGETLILVPSRELASQWHDELLAHTTLTDEQVGEYHGGTKDVRPVTIATYQTAGMDRHRQLFDSREWGLIIYDECLSSDTTIETREGRTTFSELDTEYEFDPGWNREVDFTVRTYLPKQNEYDWTAVNGVYKTEAPVRRIETNTGRTLEATPNHTHLVFDPDTCTIEERDHVTEGDFLVQPHAVVPSATHESEAEARAELMGWFIGDGHLNEYGDIKFSFARRAERQIEIVRTLCEELEREYSTFENSRGDLTLWAPNLEDEIDWDGASGDKADSVAVPRECYNWSNQRIGALLRGLFDAEGSVDKKGRIQFNSASEHLAEDVSLLLQKLGIMSRRFKIERDNDGHNDIYRITIPSCYGTDFRKLIGFRLGHKADRLTEGESPATGLPVGTYLQQLKNDADLTNEQIAEMAGVSGTTICGVINGEYRLGQQHIHELATSLREHANRELEVPEDTRNQYNITYGELAEEADTPQTTIYKRFQRKEEHAVRATTDVATAKQEAAERHADRLGKLSDIVFVEVTDVEEAGTQTVYDFETESHTFLADGFLTHNCQHIPSNVFRRSADLQSKHRLGLSVDGDTVVPFKRDGSISLTRIEDFATRHLGGDTGIADVEGVETLGVTDDGNVIWTEVNAVMRHHHGEEMYEVRAENGRKVTITEDHSVMVFDGEKSEIVGKRPESLTEADHLLQPINHTAGDGDKSSIDVMNLLDEGYVLTEAETPDSVYEPLYEQNIGSPKDRYNWKTRGNLPLDVAREIEIDREHIKGVYVYERDKYIPPSVPIEDFARLVGLFIADGALDGHRVEFYATDTGEKSEVEEFKRLICRLHPEADISTLSNGRNCTTVRISGPLVRIFENIGLSNGARTKSVPEIILSRPSAYEPFVEGVILGDGHVQERSGGKTMTTISTSSDILTQELNFMLSSLGYVGGNYRRNADVAVREEEHDVVTNNLVRFNPKNKSKNPRKSMTPFTDELRQLYESVNRTPRTERRKSDVSSALQSGLTHRCRLNDEELQTIIERTSSDEYEWLTGTDVAMLEVDSVMQVESEEYVYDLSTEEENFLGDTLFCHNSATPVREDDREEDIFTLVGPPIGTDWDALFEAGYVQEPSVQIRYVPWGDEDARSEYASTVGHEKRQAAASNPAKIREIRHLLSERPGAKALIFVEYLDQGDAIAEALNVPFVSGEMRHARREHLLQEFRSGQRDVLVVSRVGDEGIDLPDAELAIVASGLGGSRRQGAQRAGRTMRPTGNAQMYVLATRGTTEEEFARQRMQHLSAKGVRVTERGAEAVDD